MCFIQVIKRPVTNLVQICNHSALSCGARSCLLVSGWPPGPVHLNRELAESPRAPLLSSQQVLWEQEAWPVCIGAGGQSGAGRANQLEDVLELHRGAPSGGGGGSCGRPEVYTRA